MYCTNCGQALQPNATACLSCGQRVRRPIAPPAVPNYLVQSILVTFCCCLPFGIVAVVYAAQVNDKVAKGDIDGAMKASQNAKTWSIVAFSIGLLVLGLRIGLGILGALSDQ